MQPDDVYAALMEVGFGEYDARAYCALLAEAPANGYSVARRSGVPRPKVYECLERLVARGAAVPVETCEDGARVYAPTDPETLIGGIARNMTRACARALDMLETWRAAPGATEVLWRVASVPDLIHRAKALADEARETLHAALWPEEFERVYEHLSGAVRRGVRTALVLYGAHEGVRELQRLGAGAIEHGRSKLEYLSILGRQFVLVADRRHCISGSVFAGDVVDGAYTLNRGLVTNAVDLVNHEIYLERILTEVGAPVLARYGADLERLDAFDRPATGADPSGEGG